MAERTWKPHGVGIAIALMICWTGATAVAQSKPAYKQPITPWGEPDLRGTWPLNHLISTPFQRPDHSDDHASGAGWIDQAVSR